MDKKANKYVAVAYKLYATADGNTELVEEATEEKPFQFITGFGITLDEFENQIYALEQGAAFDFVLPKEQAYGEYEEARVLKLDKSMFSINGLRPRQYIQGRHRATAERGRQPLPRTRARGDRRHCDNGPQPSACRHGAQLQRQGGGESRGNQPGDRGHGEPSER